MRIIAGSKIKTKHGKYICTSVWFKNLTKAEVESYEFIKDLQEPETQDILRISAERINEMILKKEIIF